MRKPPLDGDDYQPVPRSVSNALTVFVGSFLSSLVEMLVERLVPLLAERLAVEQERRETAGLERVSATEAAKRARVRPATISRAVRLSPGEPGYLASRVEGEARGALAGTERRTVTVRDLMTWKSSGGADAALHLDDDPVVIVDGES